MNAMTTSIRLFLARLKRQGLRRERARLHQQRAGIDYELHVNAADARAAEAKIAELQYEQRRARELADYPVAE